MRDQSGCAEVNHLLPELALGVLADPERALTLRHLWSCSACSADVARLSHTSDQLLLLPAGAQPPRGFEAAAVARLAARRQGLEPGRWNRTRKVLVPALAAALAAVLGVGAALLMTADVREAGERYRATLAIADGRYFNATPLLEEDGNRAGTFFLYRGVRSWGMLTVASAPVDGSYSITMTDRDGIVHDLGECEVHQRSATCGFPIDLPVLRGARVQLAGPADTVLMAPTRVVP